MNCLLFHVLAGLFSIGASVSALVALIFLGRPPRLHRVTFTTPVAEIIRQHHERMDGSGYPRGLKGDEILPEARALAVADVIESMGSHRPYRTTMDLDAALTEISNNRGKLYAPEVVDAVVRLVRDKGYRLPD